jgi:hypothetical protein
MLGRRHMPEMLDVARPNLRRWIHGSGDQEPAILELTGRFNEEFF